MSVFTAPSIAIDDITDLDSTKEYLRDLTKKIRFLSQNVDEDNFTPEEYSKFYENKTKAVELSYDVDEFRIEVTDYETDTLVKLEQLADEISLLVSKGDVTNEINISTEKIYISGNYLRVNSTNFKLDTDGNLTMAGTINATSGNFGTFQIAKDNTGEYLQGDGSSYIDAADLSGTDINATKLNITTDADISGCSINFERCTVKTTKNTYFGWFYSDDVTVSGTVYCNAARANYVVATGRLSCYDIWSNSEGIAYSDRRLKKDIKPIDGREALRYLMELRPVMYRLKDEDEQCYGLIAQDVLRLGDRWHIVHQHEDGFYSIEYGALDAVLCAALKYQQEEMEALGVGSTGKISG